MTQLLAAHTGSEGHGLDMALHQRGELLTGAVLPFTAFIAGARAK